MRGIVASLLVALLGGCASVAPRDYATYLVEAGGAAQSRALTHLDLPIASGQLILSDQGRPDSLLLALIADEYAPFVHAGVIAIEDGEAVVYEAFATLRPGFGGPPTDALAGRVRRGTLRAYLDRVRFAAIYDPGPSLDAAAVAAYARARHLDRTAFDPYFDDRDGTRVYCSEFVARALQAGGAPPAHRSPVNDNRSLAQVLAWLKVASPTLIPAGTLVEDRYRVALLSRDFGPSQVETWFELKRELHRRFTPEQKLGNVFAWTWHGLTLRPGPRALIDQGLEQAGRLPAGASARSAELVRTLAERTLGPVPGDARLVTSN